MRPQIHLFFMTIDQRRRRDNQKRLASPPICRPESAFDPRAMSARDGRAQQDARATQLISSEESSRNCCTGLYCTAQHCTALHCTALYHFGQKHRERVGVTTNTKRSLYFRPDWYFAVLYCADISRAAWNRKSTWQEIKKSMLLLWCYSRSVSSYRLLAWSRVSIMSDVMDKRAVVAFNTKCRLAIISPRSSADPRGSLMFMDMLLVRATIGIHRKSEEKSRGEGRRGQRMRGGRKVCCPHSTGLQFIGLNVVGDHASGDARIVSPISSVPYQTAQ